MPDIEARLDFLEDLPLYNDETPYFYLPGKGEDVDPDDERLTNLAFRTESRIVVQDMRNMKHLRFDNCGFEYVKHHVSNVHDFVSATEVDLYISETALFLKQHFCAERVVTYDLHLRKNEEFACKEFDFNDKLQVESPVKAAHNGRS